MRRRWREMLASPAAEGAEGPGPRDLVLVGILLALTFVEAVVRPDLPWPLATALVTCALVAALPWRRRRPLLVVTVTTALSAAFQVAQSLAGVTPTGLATMFAVLLAPYALFRWANGRDRIVGGGILVAGLILSLALGSEGVPGAVAGLLFVGGAGLIGALRRERVTARTRELEVARSAEREALARDLHDTVAHHVSAIALRAQAAATHPADAARVSGALDAIERDARAVLDDMRALVRALRVPAGRRPLAGLGDLAALADPGPPLVSVRIGGGESGGRAEVADVVASTLFRIAQEAVTNARRHARAVTAIEVDVMIEPDAATLVVADDGVGSPEAGSGGHGLLGIAERAALLGGDVTAGPAPEGGWRVHARLPRTVTA